MIIINAQEVSGLPGDSLFTGPNGIKFKEKAHQRIYLEDEHELVKIDLKDTNTIDSSFCREGFVYLINELEQILKRPQILFINVSENAAQNLEVSFTYHKKNCLILDKNSKFKVIGKLAEAYVETIKVMIELKEASVRDVARKLEIEELTTVNNRLKTIYDMCIINRKEVSEESGGKEYLYYLRS